MAIQWFPGHMNKARKDITARLKQIDVVIEMLDARLPASSANPMLAQMARGKLSLKVLNKQDLADAQATAAWLKWYQSKPNTHAIGLDASERSPAQRIVEACRQLAPHRMGVDKPLRVMICGIPNVGKSTLINSMTGRKIAKTGNMPGVTKAEQRIMLESDFELFDTPGMLWPKIIVEQSGYNLAASGAIGRNAMDEEEVTIELLAYLMKHYMDLLISRYKLEDTEGVTDYDIMQMIGRKRGAVMSGGRINIQKTAELIITDFRDGNIGRITLERPGEWEEWEREGKAKEQLRIAAKKARIEAHQNGNEAVKDFKEQQSVKRKKF